MPTFDEELRDRIRGAGVRQQQRDDLLDTIVRRKHRHAMRRKVGTIATVAVVLLGTVGVFALLNERSRQTPEPLVAPVSTGGLVVSLADDTGTHLYLLPSDRVDLDPSDGATAARSNLTRLTTGKGVVDDQPTVSPDGTRVAFVRSVQCQVPGFCPDAAAIVVIGIDGEHQRFLETPGLNPSTVSWSPTGEWLAVRGPVDDSFWLVRPDGTDLHQVHVDGLRSVADVSWSADGTHLVLAGSASADGQTDLWSVTPDGSQLVNLTNTPDTTELAPAASPDGSWIAFRTDQGIDQIPSVGDTPARLVNAPQPDDAELARPAWTPDGRNLTFLIKGASTSSVYALPEGAGTAFPISPGSSYAWQPVPAGGTTTTGYDLGLSFPTCRVSSMPIVAGAVAGTAVVFTKEGDGGCPRAGDGFVGVGVDTTGDGVLDASWGPIPDCYFRCEALAAPDVNADGVSEVAVSNEGADGFGVSLYAVTPTTPSIEPIIVSSTFEQGPSDGDPLQFGWVDVATHASSAGCTTGDAGPLFELYGTEKLTPAQVQTTSMVVQGATATVTSMSTDTMPFDQAPMPGTDICGAPLFGSAAGLGSQPGLDIGLETNICDVSRLRADFTGDGQEDTVWVGTTATENRCPIDAEHRGIAAIDTNGDGLADGQATKPFPHCIGCSAFAAVDFNADGASELAILLQEGSTPQYGIYEAAFAGSGRDGGLYPAHISSGSEQFPEGDPLTFLAGGDEGFSGAVKCDGFPDHPVLIVWASSHNVDGGAGSPRDVVMTKLTMQPDGSFAAVDALHQQQVVGDPPLFDGSGTPCGVDWDPFQ